MVITTYQLPQIERLTEEILEAEDLEVLKAFEVLLNGYKRAQKRTLAITKAYNELESIALKILKEHEAEHERSKAVSFNSNTSFQNTSSTSKAQNCQQKRKGVIDAEVIDLDKSPVLIEAGNENHEKKKSLEKASVTDDFASTSKCTKTSNKRGNESGALKNSIKGEKVRNDENRPPLVKNSNTHDSNLQRKDARSSIKLAFARGIYNLEKNKTSNHKLMKQATLIFEPVVQKLDVSVSEKESLDKSQDWDDLFDEDYCANKKHVSSANKQNTKTDVEYPLRPVETTCSKIVTNRTETRLPEGDQEGQSTRDLEVTIVEPNNSQINDTARSLFDDDDDADNFQESPELYTCVEMSAPKDVSQPIVNIVKPVTMTKLIEPEASTSKVPQYDPAPDSFDETFFAPGEIDKKTTILPSTSKNVVNENPCTSRQSLKGKREQPNVNEIKELEDLALQEINWDADIFQETPVENPKRALNNNFGIPSERKKRSPECTENVNSKVKRSKLQGWSCSQCQDYYEDLGLPEEELQKRKDMCSRHKSKFNPRYNTPKGFWNAEFSQGTDSSDSEYEKTKN